MKDFNSPELRSELSDLIENIAGVKSENYGMILRTLFNLHNASQFSIRLLEISGMKKEDLLQLVKINEGAISDTLLSMYRMLIQIDPAWTKENAVAWSEQMETDLKMLLKKQEEYQTE